MENESWSDYLRIYPDEKDKDPDGGENGPDPNSEIRALPLQFANVERLRRHDALYIFDEVGAGKTVMAGLMALSRLRGNPDRGKLMYQSNPKNRDNSEDRGNGKVLVITTNAVVKNGQFANTWRNTLHFAEAGQTIYTYAHTRKGQYILYQYVDVIIINNNYKKLKEICDQACFWSRKEQKLGHVWELIIIDEADAFLNSEINRSRELARLRAKKVVLMTATPIRNNTKRDIRRYVEIAETILDVDGSREKRIDDKTKDLIDRLEDRNQLICKTFDLDSPVTRYFKSTILGLRKDSAVNGSACISRQPAEVCYYYSARYRKKDGVDDRAFSKAEAVLKYLRENWPPEDQFIIFVRLKEDEALPLKKYLNENGFVDFDPALKQSGDTVAVSTGDTKDLWKYSGIKKDLPRVLIMTYQLAEQGVDLPGFNHVLNYYIPPSPASLEQRYGRVDRLSGSSYNKIYIAYFIGGDETALYDDLNTLNYARSLSAFFRHVLTCTPSRGVLINEEMFGYLTGPTLEIKDRVEKLAKWLNKREKTNNMPMPSSVDDLIEELPQELRDIAHKLPDYIKEISPAGECLSVSEYIQEVNRFSRNLRVIKKELLEAFRDVLVKNRDKVDPDQISNSVFYYVDPALSNLGDSTDPVDLVQWIKDLSAEDIAKNLHCVSSEECISDVQNQNYNDFLNCSFKRYCTVPAFLRRDHAIELDKEFEKRFIKNELLTGDWDLLQGEVELFKEYVQYRYHVKEGQKDLIERAQEIMLRLPLFRMCDILENILVKKLKDRYRFDRNPIPDILIDLREKMSKGGNRQWFTDEFFEGVFFNIPEDAGAEKYNRLFWIRYDEKYRICASPWYRLVFFLMWRNGRKMRDVINDGFTYYWSYIFANMLLTDGRGFRPVFAPPCPLTYMPEGILESMKERDFNKFADELTISICATVSIGYENQRDA